jgi:tetratricopeptide (TPR) repeat protein
MGKTVWPMNLAVYYPHPESIPPWITAGSLLLLLLLTLGCFWTARRQPALLMGWLWFLGLLFPVLGLFHGGGQALADRYTYVPLIGLFVGLVWGAAAVARHLSLRRSVLAVLSGVVLLGCTVLTRAQVSRWKDSVTLWEHTVAVTERNYSAHNMLATALALEGQLDRALGHHEQALEINPRHARSHNNFGLTLGRLGRETEALEHLREAVRLDPSYAEAFYNLGLAFERQGDAEAALEAFTRLLALRPASAQGHAHLGALLLRRGERERARHHLSEALRLNPGLRQPRQLLDGLGAAAAP